MGWMLLRGLVLGFLIGLLACLAPTPLGRGAEEALGLYWLFKVRGNRGKSAGGQAAQRALTTPARSGTGSASSTPKRLPR